MIAKKIIEIFSDETKALTHVETLKPETEKQETWDSKQKVSSPFIEFVTSQLCTLYNNPIKRTLNEKYQQNEQLNDLLKEVVRAYEDVQSDIDTYTFVGGMAALKPFYDLEDGFDYILFTSEMLDYTPKPLRADKASEIALSYSMDAADNKSVSQEEVWSVDDFQHYVDDTEQQTEGNPYGFIPISVYRSKKPGTWMVYCTTNESFKGTRHFIHDLYPWTTSHALADTRSVSSKRSIR